MDTPTPRPGNDLTEFERRLSNWTLMPSAVDRDRMLFEAGRASACTEARGWAIPGLAAALAMLAVGLGGWAIREHAQRRALELVLLERTCTLDSTLDLQRPGPAHGPILVDPPAPESYLELSRRLATIGPDEFDSPLRPSTPQPRAEGSERILTPLGARQPGGLVDL